MSIKFKNLIIPLSIVGLILIGLFFIWPSFNLALTGDDFLTFWRYQYYVEKNSWHIFSFIFTDYGPQDTLFALIHHIFSFKPLPYFIVSFIMRCIAAFSFYPLLKYITKNKYIPFLAVLFFLTTAVGLETTNWVFNMPSYISIALLNIFILSLIKTTEIHSFKQIVITGMLFAVVIILQPIRMIFLPGFITLFSLFWLVFNALHKKSLKYPLITLSFLLFIFLLIFLFTHIGDSIGVSINLKDRIGGVWLKQAEGVNGLSKEIQRQNFTIFLYPIAQIGNVVLPNLFLTLKRGNLSNLYIITRNLLPSLIIAIFLDYMATYIFTNKMKRFFLPTLTIILFWTFLVYYLFRLRAPYPMQPSEIEAFLVGGYFLMFIGIFYISTNIFNKKIIFASLLILVLSFIVPWIRFPYTILESTGRYLIVSATGLTILLISIFSISKNKTLFLFFVFIPLTLINLKTGRAYLHKLSFVRDTQRTEKIRSSVPTLPSLSKDGQTTMVYFQADSDEVLYHSLMFGFPVITSYYQNVADIMKVAYTQDWSEVVNSYTTGEGLRRFSTIPIRPVQIENIYSFRLEYDHLVDTTTETRNRLLSL
jgi:hypothetical protein